MDSATGDPSAILHHRHHHDHTSSAMSLAMDGASSDAAAPSSLPGSGDFNSMAMMMMPHMHMTFYWGPEVTLLFSGWTTHTWTEYAVALLLTLLLAVAHEALLTYRARFLSSLRATSSLAKGQARGVSDGLPPTQASLLRRSTAHIDRVVVAALYGVSTALGYLLMLVAMSFNVGIFVAVVLGHAAGMYVFGLPRLMTPEQHHVPVDSACGS